jgi:hypothetical protein
MYKLEGHSPDEVLNFFNLPNPSSHITPCFTHPLTEMSTRNEK